jgi:hypothetical protein
MVTPKKHSRPIHQMNQSSPEFFLPGEALRESVSQLFEAIQFLHN